MLPGGGIARGEEAMSAAKRELSEETGCTLRDAVVHSVVEEPLYGTTNRVHMIAGSAMGQPQPDGREIIELGFFARDALPRHLSPSVVSQIDRWFDAFDRLGREPA